VPALFRSGDVLVAGPCGLGRGGELLGFPDYPSVDEPLATPDPLCPALTFIVSV
jgi:hypothetical protein